MSASSQLLLAISDGSSGVANNPTFSNVQLLLHCDGSNGSTTITDSSSAARTVTAVGNAQISTAQSKWGGASVYLDGSGDYLSIADAASLEPGAGDFAIEGWFRTTTVAAGTASIFSKRADGSSRGPFLVRRSGSTLQMWATTISGSWDNNASGGTLVTDTWHWIALAKIGETLRLYLDGALVTNMDVPGTLLNTSAALLVGGETDGSGWTGYVDDVRYTVDESHITVANHVIPAGAFPDS